jgi:hypothetical protein
VLALRQRNYDVAAQRLERARDLAPQNDQIYDLLGILEGHRGHSAEAIAPTSGRQSTLIRRICALRMRLRRRSNAQGDANSEG